MRRKVAWLLICSLILSLVMPSVMPAGLQSGLQKAYAAESGIQFKGPDQVLNVVVDKTVEFSIRQSGGTVAAGDEIIVLASPSNAGKIELCQTESGEYEDSITYAYNTQDPSANRVYVSGEKEGTSEVWLKYKKAGDTKYQEFKLANINVVSSSFKLNLNNYGKDLFVADADVKDDSVTYFLDKTYAKDHYQELERQGGGIRMDTGYLAPRGASYAMHSNPGGQGVRFNVNAEGYIVLDCSAFKDGQGNMTEQNSTFNLQWYNAQDRMIGAQKTIYLKIRYEEVRTVYPEESRVNMNAGSLPEKLFPGGYCYDEKKGTVDVYINPAEVEKYDFSSGPSAFSVQVKVPDGWTPVSTSERGNAEYDDKTRIMSFGANLKDRQQNNFYQQMINNGSASYDAIKNFTNAEGKKVALTVHFTIHKELATWPANGTVELPEAADYIKSSSYTDGVLKLLIYEGKLQTAVTQKAAGEEVSAQFKVQVPDGVSAVSCTVEGNAVSLVEKGGKKYAPVSSWLATKKADGMEIIRDGARETFHINWLDAGGNVLSGSVLTVAIKYAPGGEYKPYQEVDGARVSFELTCWPEGEPQPITVNYSNGKYTVTLDMDQEKWQKAYENRNVGEDGLYLRAKITPAANAAYGRTVSSGDFIERQQPEMMLANVRILESGQSFIRVRGETNFSTMTKIADIVDNGTTATVNPTAWTSHMLTAAWKDQDGDLISLSSENTTYCEYLRFGTAHKDSKPVQIKTESFKTDGASITLDLENKYDAYEYQPATFVNNSVNYYLNGDALDAALKADASFGASHTYIKTGFKAPTGAKGYILERANRGRAEEYTFKTGEDQLVLEEQIFESGKFRNIYQDTFHITWVMADGSKVKDNPLAIRTTVVWAKNAYDQLGWTRMPANRFVLPDSLTGGYGINVTIPEAGRLNTEFTGGKVDPVFEEIDRDKIEITVPDYGEKILQYETSSWEGSSRYGTFENNVQEVIGVNERVDLGRQTTIKFWYGATPTYSTIIENGVERKIWTGASFGNNEDSASFRYVRWYGEGGKVLGTEWFMITADECYTEETTDGQAAVTKAVTEPVLVSDKFDLRVQNYIVGTLGTDAKESLYVRMCPVDEKGFEVHTGKTSVYWPYPEGMNKANAEKAGFEVYHYTDALHLFKESVSTEFTDYGIKLTVNSFSPFLMAWTKQETPTPTPTPTPSDDNGGSSVVVIKPDKAVTPITVAADGKQMMGTAAISLVPAKFTAAEKAAYVENASWSKDAYGYWYLKNAKGETYKSCWVLVSDKAGSKPVGNASWYYLDANGRMLTGWQWIAGADGKKRCYYFNKEDGSMYGACLLGGTTPDNYKLNEKGEWVDEKGNVQVK